MLAQAVWTYEELEQVPRALRVEVEASLLDDRGVAHLKSLLDEHAGTLPLYVRVQGAFGEALLALREVRVGEEALGALGPRGSGPTSCPTGRSSSRAARRGGPGGGALLGGGP